MFHRLGRLLGRLAEQSGAGRWLEGTPRSQGIYFLLLGDAAEEIASLFPAAGKNQSCRAVILTNRPHAARHLRNLGHMACEAMINHGMKPRDQLRCVLGQLLTLSTIYEPAALMLTPDIALDFPRPQRLLASFFRAASQQSLPSCEPVTVMLPAVMTGRAAMGILLEKLGEIDRRLNGCPILACGSPDYFDHAQSLQLSNPGRLRWLGWRGGHQAEPQAILPAAPADICLLSGDPVMANEAMRALAALPNRNRWRSIKTVSLCEALSQNNERPALFIADGTLEPLPLLAANRPVLIAWNPRAPRPAMLRASYFMGQQRWPAFEGAAQLARLLDENDLHSLWSPYAERRTPLETAGPDSGGHAGEMIQRMLSGEP